MSLQLFDSFTAVCLRTPESWTNETTSSAASTRFTAVETGMSTVEFSSTQQVGVAGVGVEPGADGGAAAVGLPDDGTGFEEPGGVRAEHYLVGTEFLAEGHRDASWSWVRPIFTTATAFDGLAVECGRQPAHALGDAVARTARPP